MLDRGFTEVDLRGLLEQASRRRRDVVKGRWVIVTRHRGQRWEVMVEPDSEAELLVVITAYPVGKA